MDNKLTYSLHSLVWQMDNAANHLLKPKFNISFAKFYVLAVLNTCQPTTQANLAKSTSQSTAAISNSLAILEKEGFVKVTVDPSHKRHNIVKLTNTGKKLVDDASAFLEEQFMDVTSGSNIDTERLIDDIEKMSTHMQNFVPPSCK